MKKFYWRIQRWFRRKTKRCTACGAKHNGVHFMGFIELCRWCGKSWAHGRNYGMSKERFIREFTQ